MFRALLLLLISVLVLLSGLLCFEYICLKQQVARVVEIQEDYQTYTNAFRKIMRDYQRLKDGEEETLSEEDDEKKKESTFLIVNREPEYLRRSAARFMRQQRMESILSNVYPGPSEFNQPHRLENTRQRRRISIRKSMRRELVGAQLARQRAYLHHKPEIKDIHFEWPVDRSQFWISSFFGARRKPDRSWGFHYGIDLAAIKGTPVKAVAPGVIIEAGSNKGYGNTVVIMHNKKYKTRYAHLHRIYVRRGQSVNTGDCIGSVGDTGLVRKRGRYASHLHLEVYIYGKKINPLYFFV